MQKKTFYLLIVWGLITGCEGKYPLKADYEIAEATIIGREACSSDTSLNAWLIDLGPTLSGKTSKVYYGKEAIIQGKQYRYVVKTYSPLISSLDSTQRYVFSFYVEDVLPTPSCDLPITARINVKQIRVTEASIKAP